MPVERRLTWRWAGAYAGLWLVLALAAESDATAELAPVIGWTIAVSAAMLLYPDLANELGLAKGTRT